MCTFSGRCGKRTRKLIRKLISPSGKRWEGDGTTDLIRTLGDCSKSCGQTVLQGSKSRSRKAMEECLIVTQLGEEGGDREAQGDLEVGRAGLGVVGSGEKEA